MNWQVLPQTDTWDELQQPCDPGSRWSADWLLIERSMLFFNFTDANTNYPNELLLDSWRCWLVDDYSCVLNYWLLSLWKWVVHAQPLAATMANPFQCVTDGSRRSWEGAHKGDPYWCKAILSCHSLNSGRHLFWKALPWQQDKKVSLILILTFATY